MHAVTSSRSAPYTEPPTVIVPSSIVVASMHCTSVADPCSAVIKSDEKSIAPSSCGWPLPLAVIVHTYAANGCSLSVTMRCVPTGLSSSSARAVVTL